MSKQIASYAARNHMHYLCLAPSNFIWGVTNFQYSSSLAAAKGSPSPTLISYSISTREPINELTHLINMHSWVEERPFDGLRLNCKSFIFFGFWGLE